VFRSTLA